MNATCQYWIVLLSAKHKEEELDSNNLEGCFCEGMEDVAQPSKTAVSWKVKLFLVLLVLLIIFDVARSNEPWLVALNAVLWVVPVVIGIVVVQRSGGDALPRNLLLTQMMLCGELGTLLALVLEVAIMVAGAFLLFKTEIKQAANIVLPYVKDGSQLDAVDLAMISLSLEAYVKTINVGKLVAYALFFSFIVAASVEEFMKWLFGRRAQNTPDLTPSAFAAAVMASALGFAAVEHYVYSYLILTSMTKTVAVKTGLSLCRAVIILPLHAGTGGILGVAMAKRVVLKQNASVFVAWMKAVTIHGVVAAVGLVPSVLIYLKLLPKWVDYLTIVVDVLIVVPLIAMVRASLIQLGRKDDYRPLGDDANV